jgi:hypothetical protein
MRMAFSLARTVRKERRVVGLIRPAVPLQLQAVIELRIMYIMVNTGSTASLCKDLMSVSKLFFRVAGLIIVALGGRTACSR